VSLVLALREEIRRRFPEMAMDFGPDEGFGRGELAAHIPCPSGAIGDLFVTADEDEATVHVEGMTHGHFAAYTLLAYEVYEAASTAERDEAVIAGCCGFLEDLFRDDVVVWTSKNGRSGGWYYLDHSPRKRRRGSRAGTWSAPNSDRE